MEGRREGGGREVRGEKERSSRSNQGTLEDEIRNVCETERERE